MKKYIVKKIDIISKDNSSLTAIVQIWISEKRAIVTKLKYKELDNIQKKREYYE